MLGLLVLGISVYLVAARLRVRADFTNLLPRDAPAVRDMERLAARVVARDTALVLVIAPNAEARAAALDDAAARLATLDRGLVDRIERDDAETRGFLHARAHLLIPLPDLVAARDALANHLREVRLAANPLYIELDDEPPTGADDVQLDRLRERRRAAEARLARSGFMSEDGTIGLVVVRTPFSSTDVARGRRLVDELSRIRGEVEARHGVRVGYTGGVVTTVIEHDALVDGMISSGVVTGVLVALLLGRYLLRLLALLTINLTVATSASFALAVFSVGHLNAATAFLGAIIAGNGINYGIILIARYRRESERAGPEDAMARALAGTLRPTLVAALGAAIAYGSLAATSFRGFADFAAIGAAGMLLCWLASYSLLPALVLRFARADTARAPTRLARTFARVTRVRRRGLVLAVAAGCGIVAGAVVFRYIAADPFEYDLRNLRSTGDAAADARRWIQLSDATFGKSISGRIFIAADRPDQVALVVDAVRAIEADRPADERAVGAVSSILDVIPPDQQRRIEVLGELRALLDDPAIATLDDAERAELRELRPPEDLRPIKIGDVPTAIREALVERDGRVGLLVAVRPGPQINQWNGKDLLRFASAIRTLHLANGETVTTSGASVVFADILASIERDGPRVTGFAAALLVAMVLLVAGWNRRALAVLAATLLGTVAMVATCALVGIRVNFLDFIALPITLGLGIDYAINLAHGEDATSSGGAGAVVICSATTIVGYGSLLLSDNGAIRGFGTASLIGELTCLLAALAIVPAIAWRSSAPARHPS